MLDKYGKNGLVVLGVALDDPKDAKALASVRSYLEKNKVPFRNVALDVPPDKLPPTLRFNGVPGAFVFNREGRYVRKLPLIDSRGEPVEDFDYSAVDKAVADLFPSR